MSTSIVSLIAQEATSIHGVRITFVSLVSAMLLVDGWTCGDGWWAHGWIALFGLCYPYLLSLFSGASAEKQLLGKTQYLFDAYFGGAAIAALGTALVPASTIAAILLFTWSLLGGQLLLVVGLTTGSLAFVLNGANVDRLFGMHLECVATDILAATLSTGYFCVVGLIIFRVVARLKDDKTRAEAEFLAVQAALDRARSAFNSLVPVPLRENPSSGTRTAIRIDPLAIALIQMRGDGLAPLHAALDRIGTRHGVECLKTFVGAAMLVAAMPLAPNRIADAVREFLDYAINHAPTASRPLTVDAWLHLGPVEMEVVRAERFDFDIRGEIVDELMVASRQVLPNSESVRVFASPAFLALAPPTVVSDHESRFVGETLCQFQQVWLEASHGQQ